MKLVILHHTLPAYRKDFFNKLSDQLGKSNIELIVMHGINFFNKSIKVDENPGYKAIPLNTIQFKFFGFDIAWWKGILRKVISIKPGMVIIHPGPGNISIWFIYFYCFLNKIKIGEWTSGYVRQDLTGIKRKLRVKVKSFFLNRTDFILTYGTKAKDDLVSGGFKESKVFVAQNTIYTENILVLNRKKKSELIDSNISFLFVGALIPEKNLDLAIKVITLLVREKFNITFNIIGKGEIIDDLRQLVVREKMESNIFLLGPKYDSELASYFFDADIFLLPGTGGLAVNEAMAYGLPVISTMGDGTIIDLLYEGQNGFYLDDNPDFDNLYKICKKVMVLNKSQLSDMGILSRQIVSEKATLQNMVSAFEKAILNEIS